MSLLSIIGTATQSLLNSEIGIGVVSENVSNAQNPNYVQRTTTTVDSASGNQVVNVTRQVNQSVQNAFLTQTGGAASASYLNQIYQQLEQLDGSGNGTPVLSNAAQSFLSAFQDYEAEPESGTTQGEAMQAAQGLVSAVQTIANGVEAIATQVQQQTQSDVGTLNTDLTTISQLNGSIVSAKAQGLSTATLEDQRDQALTEVAGLLPITTTLNADGSMRVATPGGVTLVGQSAVQFAYSGYTLGVNGTAGTNPSITLVGDASNTSLNSSFSSGKIGAELNILRVDDAGAASSDPSVAPLEKMRRQLDAFADQFYNATTPTAFQTAYNTPAIDTGSNQLATNLFVITGPGPGGSPQPAASDRFGFKVNPLLTAGTDTLKPSAANAVVQALTQNSATTPFSAGDVTNFTGTIVQLANAISTAQTQRASTAGNASTQAAASLSATQTLYNNSSGVSVDQQLAQLLVLQNSYAASAKVISITNSILTTLLSDFPT